MFNRNEIMTFGEIQNTLKISDLEMKDSMMKLCNPKTGIMLKENSKKPVFEPNEKLWLNKNYNGASIRFSFIPTKTPT